MPNSERVASFSTEYQSRKRKRTKCVSEDSSVFRPNSLRFRLKLPNSLIGIRVIH